MGGVEGKREPSCESFCLHEEAIDEFYICFVLGSFERLVYLV